ncbi:MAG: DNA replication/repair protein RecF [Colwelliaceae bacterium]|jgi:DNA replication and repair protein RecF|nr:DNA replication/repair protein RecF [Colwelliaceae bacterium]
MSVVELQTVNFRNLDNSKTLLHPELNFLIGDNGSGKSSILESLFYLAHGKSFRTSKSDSLIKNSFDDFIISVKTKDDSQLGIQRSNSGDVKIKINGVKTSKLSDLAKNIAVQIVTPESFKLFSGGPKERRKFVDLGLFHVEHCFSNEWKSFQKVYKHRNACLRNKNNIDQIDYWTAEFCRLSEVIASLRKTYVARLTNELIIWLSIMLPNLVDNITLQYLQGWNSKKELSDILKENRDREIEKGYSIFGAHKFDIRFQIDKSSIENTLSRGQQKLFLLALTFAQSKLIEKVKRIKPILLIDDIGAELDHSSRNAMFQATQLLNSQTIISAIDRVALEPLIPDDNNYNMFHVEHGQINAMIE